MHSCGPHQRHPAAAHFQAHQQRHALPSDAADASSSRPRRPSAVGAVKTDTAIAADPQVSGHAPKSSAYIDLGIDNASGTVPLDNVERIASGSQTSSSGRTSSSQAVLPRRMPRHSSAWLSDSSDGGWHAHASSDTARVSSSAGERRSAGRRPAEQQSRPASPAASSDRSDRKFKVEDSPPEEPQQLLYVDGKPLDGFPQPGKGADQPATELIFRLERRGDGWGEEIFPHLVLEQRPLEPPRRRVRKRSSRPEPWEVRSSLQSTATW